MIDTTDIVRTIVEIRQLELESEKLELKRDELVKQSTKIDEELDDVESQIAENIAEIEDLEKELLTYARS